MQMCDDSWGDNLCSWSCNQQAPFAQRFLRVSRTAPAWPLCAPSTCCALLQAVRSPSPPHHPHPHPPHLPIPTPPDPLHAPPLLSYLDAAFKEAMRLLPASAGGFRMLTKELRVGDVLLPPGASFLGWAAGDQCR